ncbi:MAG: PAS domain-containing protein, partial [Candidatus Rifleibacteriota bacterium]
MSKSKIDLLRAKAEEAVKTMDSAQQKSGKKPSAKELANLLNELRIYQVELEMQNEELLRAQVELEKTRDQYWQLFNNAPVGYVILDRQGMIIKVNHTFTRMVDEAQENVLGKALARFICDRDQGVFLARFKSFFANPEGKSIELRLRIKNNQELWVLLTATGIQQNQEGNQQILVNIA